MDQNCRYKINDNFEAVYMDEDLFIMPNATEAIAQKKIFTVGEIGKVIIENMQKNQCVSEIIASICDTYDVSREVAEKDLDTFLSDLLQNKIIEAVPGE